MLSYAFFFTGSIEHRGGFISFKSPPNWDTRTWISFIFFSTLLEISQLWEQGRGISGGIIRPILIATSYQNTSSIQAISVYRFLSVFINQKTDVRNGNWFGCRFHVSRFHDLQDSDPTPRTLYLHSTVGRITNKSFPTQKQTRQHLIRILWRRRISRPLSLFLFFRWRATLPVIFFLLYIRIRITVTRIGIWWRAILSFQELDRRTTGFRTLLLV